MYMWVSDREGAGGKLGGGHCAVCDLYYTPVSAAILLLIHV